MAQHDEITKGGLLRLGVFAATGSLSASECSRMIQVLILLPLAVPRLSLRLSLRWSMCHMFQVQVEVVYLLQPETRTRTRNVKLNLKLLQVHECWACCAYARTSFRSDASPSHDGRLPVTVARVRVLGLWWGLGELNVTVALRRPGLRAGHPPPPLGPGPQSSLLTYF